MPYCSQCGNQVREADVYCTRCGFRQPVPAPSSPNVSSDAVSDRTACILCYIPFFGWVVSIIVLAAQRFRGHQVVRFHAFQALYLFVAWLLVDWVVQPIVMVGPHFWFRDVWPHTLGLTTVVKLLELAIILVNSYMMLRVNDRERLRLPLIGDLAEKSL
jgi:uncharacterized membrane protein